MNDKTTINVKTLPVITKFIYTIGQLPTSYMMSMTYEEQVVWLCNYLETQVIPALNQNGQAVQELQELYELLRQYVNDYFENLDVQEEINNKLDDMVEQGTLQEIIAEYLNSKAIFGFDNVASMKNSTNLIDGSYAKTLGFYEKGDIGSAFYKVRELQTGETYNEKNLIELSSGLVAEFIQTNTYIIPEQLGAYGDKIHDDTDIFQFIIDNYDGVEIQLNKGYLINGTIIILNKVGVKIKGTIHNSHSTQFARTNTLGTIIKIDNSSQITIENIAFMIDDSITSNTITAISAEVVDDNAQSHRVNDLRIDNCYFRNLKVGINLDVASGYTYVDDNLFQKMVSGGTHVKCGENYDSTINPVRISYLYLRRNAFNANTNADDKAVDIYCCNWFYISENDFANFVDVPPITITNGNDKATDNMYIFKNSFFNSKKAIYAEPSINQNLSNIVIDGNYFMAPNNSDLIHIISNEIKTTRNVMIINNLFEDNGAYYTSSYIYFDGIDQFTIKNNVDYSGKKDVNVLNTQRVTIKNCTNGSTEKYDQAITSFSTDASSLMIVTPTFPMHEKPLLISGTYVHTSDKDFLMTIDASSVANQNVSMRARDLTGAGIGAYSTTLPQRFLVLQFNVMNNVIE